MSVEEIEQPNGCQSVRRAELVCYSDRILPANHNLAPPIFFLVCAGSFTAHHDIHVVEGLWLVNLRRLEWANISQQAAI